MVNSPLFDVVLAAAAAGVTVFLLTLPKGSLRREIGAILNPHRTGSSKHPLVDPLSGMDSRLAWDEILRREEDRLARYGHPVTVVVANLDGLDAFAAAFGRNVADCLIGPVAAALRRNARASDVLACPEYSRFVALLPETSEVAATNYIERTRAECDSWLQGAAVSVRLAVGWAQPVAGERLTDAIRIAEQRMNADRRRYDFGGAGTSESPDLRGPGSRIRPAQAPAMRGVPGRVEPWDSGAAPDDLTRMMSPRDGARRTQER